MICSLVFVSEIGHASDDFQMGVIVGSAHFLTPSQLIGSPSSIGVRHQQFLGSLNAAGLQFAMEGQLQLLLWIGPSTRLVVSSAINQWKSFTPFAFDGVETGASELRLLCWQESLGFQFSTNTKEVMLPSLYLRPELSLNLLMSRTTEHDNVRPDFLYTHNYLRAGVGLVLGAEVPLSSALRVVIALRAEHANLIANKNDDPATVTNESVVTQSSSSSEPGMIFLGFNVGCLFCL